MDPAQSSSKGPIIGIDLGTTNSLVALSQSGRGRIVGEGAQRVFIPSIVSYVDGRPLVGAAARLRAHSHPRETIHSVKRLMGKQLSELGQAVELLPYELAEVEEGQRRLLRVKVGDERLSPEQISGHILEHLKAAAERALGEMVTRAVITVPAYFDDTQRQATRDAGRIAGLEVMRIVNEPTAAALAYGLGRARSDRHTVAVYDLGGGTFDVSVLSIQDGVFRVLATNGDTYLGGDDFDLALIRCVAGAIEEQLGYKVTEDKALLSRLRESAQATKHRLTVDEVAALRVTDPATGRSFEFDVTRADFEAIITPLVDRSLEHCRRAMADAQIEPSSIDAVVLVGGSTRVPLVRAKLESLFGRPPLTSLDPDETVALGAAVQAEILSGAQRDVLLLDVIPLSLGLETVGGAVSKLIMRNETVPVVKTEKFSTSKDNQTAVIIHVLQGERELVGDCRSLARFQLKGLPPMPAGLPKLLVTFMVDENGILTVMAEEERSGIEASIEVVPVHGLTEDEVDEIVAESIDHALSDIRAHRLIDLRNESRTVLRATQRTIDEVRSVVDMAEIKAVQVAADTLEGLVSTDQVEDIARALDQLNTLTEPLADIVLDRITTATVRGRHLSDFPS